MNLFELFAKISLDSDGYEDGVKKASEENDKLKESMSGLADETTTIKNKLGVLSDQYDAAQENVRKLAEEFNKSAEESGTASKKTQELAEKLTRAEKEAGSLKSEMEKLEQSSSEAGDELEEAGDSAEEAGDDFEKSEKKASKLASVLKSAFSVAGKATVAGVGLIAGAATTGVGALLALEESTEEYRIAQGKLNTAFETAGYSAEQAQGVYTDFYSILGDTDTATEASQLLAKLSLNAEDMSTWTNIAAGVWGTFGDSLPIEGLIESANETAKVGQVTGSLADALNWAGISEDEFNEQLAACGSEAERNQLIMDTLSGTYDEASDAFYKNNEALVKARENQALVDEALGSLGETVSMVKNNILAEFLPSLAQMAEAFNGILLGEEGAELQFSTALETMITSAAEKLPAFLEFGMQILSSLGQGLVAAIPTVMQALVGAISTGLPMLLEMGAQLLNSLMQGLAQAVPQLIAALPGIVDNIVSTLATEGPKLMQSGMDMLIKIGDGIEQTLPDLIARLPQIVIGFVQFMTENGPTFLQQGVEVINSLINGILQSIPVLIQNLPQLITAFVDFIVANLPAIVDSGIDILTNLIKGIIQTLPVLVQNLPAIINAIVSGLGALLGSIVDVGVNIVHALWNGISSAIGWLWDMISGWVGGIVDGIKGLLGIHSPSRVFMDMGKNMALGLGNGWDAEFASVKKDIESGMSFGARDITTTVNGGGMRRGIAAAGTVINQYIQAVPMTPAELARQSVDHFDRLRWA